MKPLEGVKVVEFASHVVVPAATRMLAEWGAEVIKIERRSGDPWRNYPYGVPPETLFAVLGSGKKMISLNLKIPKGKEALFRLLEGADIFCTNFRPQPIARLGLGYDELHAKFPSLVYCDFTGYGSSGPDANRAGFDSAGFWASSGILGDWADAGEAPMLPLLGMGDMVTSNVLLSGMLAALRLRDKTGEGQYVTTSLLASGIWHNFSSVIACQDGLTPGKMPRRRALNSPLVDNHQCSDGRWILISVSKVMKTSSGGQYAGFMKAMGLEHLLKTDEYRDWDAMEAHRDSLRTLVKERFLTDTAENWSRRLSEADIVNQVLLTANEISRSEQAWANGYLTRVAFPSGVEAVIPKPPVQFPRMCPVDTLPAADLGAHTRDVLRTHGYSEEEVRAMLDDGAAFGA